MIGSWWMLGVISSTTLFTLLLLLFMFNQRLSHHGPTRGPSGETRLGVDLSTWMTRVFITTVLQCALLSLLSQWPASQTPLWLCPLLQGITYASAAVYYLSERDDF
ncbi:MAG: hypothetical protein ACETVR_03845 [Candidatus Bathyarchaeia archaeon]